MWDGKNVGVCFILSGPIDGFIFMLKEISAGCITEMDL